MTTFAEVIGDPIAHSKSPLIHRFWLDALGIAGDYRATRVAPLSVTPALSRGPASSSAGQGSGTPSQARGDGEGVDLATYIAQRRADPDWRGCNVTIPHKVAVMDLVDDPGDVRATIGAMNTIVRQPDGSVIGTNTDAAGFWAPIAGLDLADQPVAVIGAGGAARAVLFALARVGVGRVTILNRSPLKAAGLLATFGLKGDAVSLDVPLPPATLVVNASALGMTGQPPLDLDLSALPVDAIVYDLVYAPLETQLLAAARARELETVDGLDMLIGQAALAFELFFGAEPPRERDGELRGLLTR